MPFDLDNSFIGGDSAGYNYYPFPNSSFLVGIEGEIGYMSLTGSRVDQKSNLYCECACRRLGRGARRGVI